MTFANVLSQFLARGTPYDAARTLSQGGYVKRVTPVLPETVQTVPGGQSAYYENTGTSENPVWTRKASISFTYTAPAGRKVVGPGAPAPAASVTATLVTGAAYPMFLVFVANDGSEFLLNMSSPDSPNPSDADPETMALETSVPHIPVDRTLLLQLISGDWGVGTSEAFEAARSSSTLW